jgi:hypothetical protein
MPIEKLTTFNSQAKACAINNDALCANLFSEQTYWLKIAASGSSGRSHHRVGAAEGCDHLILISP